MNTSPSVALRSAGARRLVEPVVVLGLGNVLCTDDGLGVAAAVALVRGYEVPPTVRVLDEGTSGLALMSELGAARQAILLDAVAADAPPGTLVRLTDDDIGPAVHERLSVRQIGVADLLEGLRLIGASPLEMTLLGLVPATVEFGLARSPAVAAAMPTLVEAAIRELARFGHNVHPRQEVPPVQEPAPVFWDTASPASCDAAAAGQAVHP